MLLFRKYTKENHTLFSNLLKSRRIYGGVVQLAPDELNQDLLTLAIEHGLIISVTLSCVETGENSLVKVEERMPGFVEMLGSISADMLEIVVPMDGNNEPSSIIGLALSFPRRMVRPLRVVNKEAAFFHAHEVVHKAALESFTPEEAEKMWVDWAYDPLQFSIVDIDLLTMRNYGVETCLTSL